MRKLTADREAVRRIASDGNWSYNYSIAMNKRAVYLRRAVLALIAGLVTLGCSRTEPKISYGFIELVYYQGESKPQERFSFFIIPDDEEGIENLDELYLYHDREQLRWQMKSNDWITFTQSGKTWIGTRSIAFTGDGTLPRGQYRAVLINKGGEKSERMFSFDAPEEPRFPFPKLSVVDGQYTASSAYPENRLICYSAEGNYITTVKLPALSGTVAGLNIPASARTVALWAEDTLYFTSACTDVVAIR